MRARAIVALVLAAACVQRSAPTTMRPATDTAVTREVEEPEPCDELAQRYCEALPLPCTRVRAVLAATGTDDARCTAVDRELASLREGSGPDVYAAATAESLQRLLDASSLDTAQIDALLTGERGSDGPSEDAEIACGPGTNASGDRPPKGDRVWCVGSDGLPHGPFAVWNAGGELVQRGAYERGRLVDPGFVVPASRDVPSAAFACPHGTTAHGRVDGPEQAKWCERKGGTWHGPAFVWRDGLVTRFAVYENGRETKAFSVAE